MGTFLFSERRLRETADVAFTAAIVSSTLLLVLATDVHVGTAIACLAVGELIMLVWMIRLVARRPAPREEAGARVARVGAEPEPR